MNFRKVPVAAVPLTLDVLKSPRISRCVENARKTNIFCMLFLGSMELVDRRAFLQSLLDASIVRDCLCSGSD